MSRLLLGVLLACVAGCGLLGPPKWVLDFPSSDATYIYGVGSAGVTHDHNPDKSKKYAIDRAMQDLSYQIKTEVVAISEMHETSHNTTLRVDSVNLTDSDMKGVEIVDVWVDKKGEAGLKQRTWVLVRLPHSAVDKILARY
ncbi:MAG: LPP20 family lipoprotein [Planctomycetes bacterium]|nr:LPP20 family lipoprotein [Planctomycetota bacterium]